MNTTDRLPFPYRPEAEVAAALLQGLRGALDWAAVAARATPWVHAVRAQPAPFWAMESLLREYPISSAEGLALMRLAEALLRVPDAETAVALTADQLGRADFRAHDGEGPHRMLASLSASAIALSKKLLPDSVQPPGLLQRLGAKTVVAATVRAIQLLGRQFVLGRSIQEALAEADAQRRAQAGLRFSFDMLGEGARTESDAERYLAAYAHAIDTLAARGTAPTPDAGRRHLHQAERAVLALRRRAARPCVRGAGAACAAADRPGRGRQPEPDHRRRGKRPAGAVAGPVRAAGARRGADAPAVGRLRLAVQAYQTRALDVVDTVAGIARRRGCASWCGWSRAPTGTARSSARRKPACRATRCSRTSTTPTCRTWPARRRCWRGRRRSTRSSPPTTPAPSPPSCSWRRRRARPSSCSACTAWAKACTARC
jgi:RHH-type proline utilization regulon transcriptional repressor/proline dehydrogenase/delta 1-pyrroline-5-carboxylate dehydrogenase